MKSDDLLSSVSSFLEHPYVEVRLSDSKIISELRNKYDDSVKAYQDLRSKYDRLTSEYARECQINIILQDKIKEFEK